MKAYSMEYIDIVDKSGRPTGEIESREVVHKKGLLHRHIHAWIINSENEVLLQKRAASKKTYPNMWAMSAEGHVSSRKTLKETVVEEIQEELNIKINKNDLSVTFSYPRGRIEFQDGWIENGINTVYIIYNDTSIEDIKIQASEVADVKWMKLEDYKNVIYEKNPEYRTYPEEFPKLFETI